MNSKLERWVNFVAKDHIIELNYELIFAIQDFHDVGSAKFKIIIPKLFCLILFDFQPDFCPRCRQYFLISAKTNSQFLKDITFASRPGILNYNCMQMSQI